MEECARCVDLNADAGESFGRWQLGDDPRLLPHVTSVSVACGFHAGDPSTMRRTVQLAKGCGVAVGAHPSLPDLPGFGRRRMAIDEAELVDLCVYQVGALRSIAAVEGIAVEHVKPHGAFYAMVAEDPARAQRLADALLAVDPDLLLVLPPGDAAAAAADRGIGVAVEAFIDIEVDDRAMPVVRERYEPRDPDEIAERALAAVRGMLRSASGATLRIDAHTLCLHGDVPNAAQVAAAVVARLQRAGIRRASMRRVLAARHGEPVNASR
jgi:UPF0271 protein